MKVRVKHYEIAFEDGVGVKVYINESSGSGIVWAAQREYAERLREMESSERVVVTLLNRNDNPICLRVMDVSEVFEELGLRRDYQASVYGETKTHFKRRSRN
ncbi:MAG: hypothetical protein KJ718_03540 [Nanoarchaeota archaeon]|nr:hypothetical protein [Nanoarchaeota archaeon]MBU1051603.1 hypothetical protein [Nanoarchaeota archaeon]MBU1988039.1 hypothetical protein [Nanoarchaeota archaeon]